MVLSPTILAGGVGVNGEIDEGTRDAGVDNSRLGVRGNGSRRVSEAETVVVVAWATGNSTMTKQSVSECFYDSVSDLCGVQLVCA